MDSTGLVNVSDQIVCIFEPKIDSSGSWLYRSYDAFIYMVEQHAVSIGEDPKALCFDHAALVELFTRFVRDAWGVKTFLSRIEGEIEALGIDKSLYKLIKQEVENIGIRINTDDPRKTRISAVFALWASTFRPVHVEMSKSKLKDHEKIARFFPEFTLALCAEYLSQFGDVSFGVEQKDDAKTRLKHIVRDLHCRQLALSPLEMLFCGCFRPHAT